MIPLIIGPIVAFFGALVSRVMAWFLAASLSGALKSLAISLALFTVIASGLYLLFTELNGYLLQALQSMPPIMSNVMGPIAAMLPPSLFTCASIGASVYVAGMIYNLAKEIAKLKARAAERAVGFFKP